MGRCSEPRKEKSKILTDNIYGVDIDPQAVEVTQLSLYLKLLEDETTGSSRQFTLDFHRPLLPSLANNIKCGNSLIDPGYFLGKLKFDPEEMEAMRPFDWKQGFPDATKAGGFDCIVGNPPYRMLQPHNTSPETLAYLCAHYVAAEFKIDLFNLFLQQAIELLNENGRLGYIIPTTILNNVYAETLRCWIMDRCCMEQIAVSRGRVFADADVHTCIAALCRKTSAADRNDYEVQTTSDFSDSFIAGVSPMSQTRQATFAPVGARMEHPDQ